MTDSDRVAEQLEANRAHLRVGGSTVAIDLIADPERLARLDLVILKD
jgi:hypothetical protein